MIYNTSQCGQQLCANQAKLVTVRSLKLNSRRTSCKQKLTRYHAPISSTFCSVVQVFTTIYCRIQADALHLQGCAINGRPNNQKSRYTLPKQTHIGMFQKRHM